MLFSSYTFLFVFLPAVLVLYFLLPLCLPPRRRLAARNAILLLMSLLFYAWGEPVYVFLMLGTILANFLFGLWMPRCRHRRAALALAVGVNLFLLFFYKYAGALAALCSLPFPSVRLPLGISFYTFQALSYVVDVYRGDVATEKNPATFGTYVALFPQLVAGPIVRYSDVAGELQARSHTAARAAAGARRFAAGLCKKVLLANSAGALFTGVLKGGNLSFLNTWLALFGFSFQIYFDFSGYSDMALGLGAIFGFTFPENFNYPYTAVSFTDFWRRWHITLSSFFREYVYIPLGGNRKGAARTVLNLFVVWALTGLWHGAAINFLLWGIYWFLLLIAEKFVLKKAFARLPRGVCRVIALAGILFGWLIFAFDGSGAALTFAGFRRFFPALFGFSGFAHGNDAYDFVRHLPFLALCAIGSTPLPRRLARRLFSARRTAWAEVVLPLAGMVLAVSYLADAGYNPFLYFRF